MTTLHTNLNDSHPESPCWRTNKPTLKKRDLQTWTRVDITQSGTRKLASKSSWSCLSLVNPDISRQVIRHLIWIKACRSYDKHGGGETEVNEDSRIEGGFKSWSLGFCDKKGIKMSLVLQKDALRLQEKGTRKIWNSKSPTYKRVPFQERIRKSNLFISPTKLA